MRKPLEKKYSRDVLVVQIPTHYTFKDYPHAVSTDPRTQHVQGEIIEKKRQRKKIQGIIKAKEKNKKIPIGNIEVRNRYEIPPV